MLAYVRLGMAGRFGDLLNIQLPLHVQMVNDVEPDGLAEHLKAVGGLIEQALWNEVAAVLRHRDGSVQVQSTRPHDARN